MTTTEKSVAANVSVPILASMNNTFALGFQGTGVSVQRVAFRVFAGGDSIAWSSPCGINCSYTISFNGPGYQCVDMGPIVI